MLDIHHDRILILDFGSQYTQLIARRVRELGVYCEIHSCDMSAVDIVAFQPKGIILSGGPESVTAEETPRIHQQVFDLAVPILGICYGMQCLAQQLGGEVESSAAREYGHAQVKLLENSLLWQDAELTNQSSTDVWMSHGDKVTKVPAGFAVIAASANAPIAAIGDETRHYYGLQFHPEVTHSEHGAAVLRQFVLEICACQNLWQPSSIAESIIQQVREQVGAEHVLLGLSGGVDSSVVAALLHEAIGEQLTCLFIDNGLLRDGEADEVMATFAKHMGVKVIHVDASDVFLSALAGISDPEAKRKTIGRVFVEVFQEHAEQLPEVKWLAQGTIYPDVIESAGAKTGKAHVIKSHHNVGGLPETLHLKLLEPLTELFKDEVRKLGEALGLPHEMVYRHPFPGPGLGVRVLGEVKPEYLPILRHADRIFIEELRANDWYDKTSQALAVFIPEKSVGVKGDARSYDYVVALRAVSTIDFMTAHCSRLPMELLEHIGRRIMNEVDGVSRVVYDISSKPPSTIEWE